MSDSRLFHVRVRWTSLGLTLIVAALVSVGVVQYCLAEVTKPSSGDRFVTRVVTDLMDKVHLSRHKLDDEISQRGFKLFIEGLDPMKVYFYQSDIDEFKPFANLLDDKLEAYDTTFAQMVFKRFLQRIDQRVTLVNELLTQEFDFTIDEDMVTDPDLLHYPKNEAEARNRWRQRIKYDLLVQKAASKGEEEEKGDDGEVVDQDAKARETLTSRYRSFARRMNQFDNEELLETFLSAMTSAYDPHTSYMSKTTLKNFTISLSLNLEGIGAQLQDKEGKTIVASVVPGGAADKHGKLKKDDQIITVGQGEKGDMVDIVGEKLNDVVDKIRGDAGTIVRLGVLPAGKKESIIYKITRAKIELEDSAAHGEVFEIGSKPDGTPTKVGVIDLPSFYQDMDARRQGLSNFRSATRDVERILGEFKTKGVDAVVLDLRRNGGGSLDEAVDLTGLFIDQGPIVQVVNYRDDVMQHNDLKAGMAWDGPLVVVTSKLSASASEILAGAVQDYKRGLVVGDAATHGKGTVQTLEPLARALKLPRSMELDYGALKLTVQQFYRPKGDSTQKRGVLADVQLPSVTNHMDIGESDLDYAVDFNSIQSSRFRPVNKVTDGMVDQLRNDSKKRVAQSEDFAKLLKRITAYQARKASKRITLNEKKFFEEGDEANADKEEEERLAEELTKEKTIKRDYYLDEVLLITRDYVDALRQGKFARVN